MIVPPKVKEAFARLAEKYQKGLSLDVKKSGYYVYVKTSKYDSQTKTKRNVSYYLGKITSDGIFISKNTEVGMNVETAAAVIEANGGKILWSTNSAEKEKDITPLEEALLKELSTDADVNLTRFAKTVGISNTTVYNLKQKLEEKYGIKYIVEPNTVKLDYSTTIVLIKFLDNAPSNDALKWSFEQIPNIRLAIKTSGEYDVVVFLFANWDFGSANESISKIISEIFGKTKNRYLIFSTAIGYGYIPMREKFFELFKKEKVWTRTKNSPQRRENQFTEREYIVLKELSKEGNKPFESIAKEYGLEKNDIFYTYKKLKDQGVIRRLTINMSLLKHKFDLIVIVERLVDVKENWKKVLKILDENVGPVNRYSLLAYTSAPWGLMFAMPIFDEQQIDKITNSLKEEFSSSTVSTLIVTDILTGEFCHRLLDIKHTSVYDYCKEIGILPEEKENEF